MILYQLGDTKGAGVNFCVETQQVDRSTIN